MAKFWSGWLTKVKSSFSQVVSKVSLRKRKRSDQPESPIKRARTKVDLLDLLPEELNIKAERLLKRINDSTDGSEVLQGHLRRSDLNDLVTANCWLNDQIINSFLEIVETWSLTNDQFPRIKCMTSFLYTKYSNNKFEFGSVKGWVDKKVNILDGSFDYILFPIHSNSHWFLIWVDVRNESIALLDSMLSLKLGSTPLTAVLTFLTDYAKEINAEGVPRSWEYLYPITHQQNNGYDCGLFLCEYAFRLAKQIPLTAPIPTSRHLRAHIFRHLANNKLM